MRERWGLHVEEHGTGRPLVLLHGLVASSRFWRTTIDHLVDRYACVAPDLLGFGRSPWPDVDYSVDDHLGALESSGVMDRHEEPAVVVGHSTGAVLAIELAARSLENVERLVLISPPTFSSADDALEHIRQLGVVAAMFVDAPRLSSVLCHLICQRRRFWKHVMPAILRDIPRELVEDGLLHSCESVHRTLQRCVIEHRFDEALARVRDRGIPVSLVHPSDDDIITRVRARELARRFELELHEVESDHLFPVRDPELAARAICAELVGVCRPSPSVTSSQAQLAESLAQSATAP